MESDLPPSLMENREALVTVAERGNFKHFMNNIIRLKIPIFHYECTIISRSSYKSTGNRQTLQKKNWILPFTFTILRKFLDPLHYLRYCCQ